MVAGGEVGRGDVLEIGLSVCSVLCICIQVCVCVCVVYVCKCPCTYAH